MHAQLNTRSLPVPAADSGSRMPQCGYSLSCTSLRGAAEGRVSQSLSAGLGRGHSVARSEWGCRARWVELAAQVVACVPRPRG